MPKRRTKFERAAKADIHRQACATIEEHICWHVGGVSMVSKETGLPEVGTVTAARWDSRTFLLTADHVVKNYANSDLTFIFRPPGTIAHGQWWQRSTPGPLYRGQPLSIIRRYRDAGDDIAALEVDPNLETSGRVRFYDLHAGSKIIRPIQSSLFAIGLPFDSLEHLGPRTVALMMHTLAGNLVRPGKDLPRGFNPRKNLLMEFPPGKERREPGGFSGAGAWYQMPTLKRPIIWRPEMILAGLITHYHRSRQALEICRVERLARFLQDATK